MVHLIGHGPVCGVPKLIRREVTKAQTPQPLELLRSSESGYAGATPCNGTKAQQLCSLKLIYGGVIKP